MANTIDQIVKQNTQQKTDDKNEPCSSCGCGIQWRSFEVSPWRCLVCSPPQSDPVCRFVRTLLDGNEGWRQLRPQDDEDSGVAGEMESITDDRDFDEAFERLPEPMTADQIAWYRRWMNRG